MRMCSIASGSSGNCIFVGSGQTNLIVDCGISGRRIEQGLVECGLEAPDLDGILITHEHTDHISGLGVMSRRYQKPVYATKKTIDAIFHAKNIGDLSKAQFIAIEPGVPFKVKELEICPVSVWHDAADPVAYRINSKEKSIGILTDSGRFDQQIIDTMQGLDVLLLEANHDVHMLQAGRYPYPLKQRILSDYGHLSNELSGHLLNELLSEKMQYVILGHLSKENNYPDLAYETVRLEVDLSPNKFQTSDFSMSVAYRDRVSQMIQI